MFQNRVWEVDRRKVFWLVVLIYLFFMFLIFTVMGCSSQKPLPIVHQCTCTYSDGSMKQFQVADVESLNEIVFSINENPILVPIISCNCPTIGHQ